MATILAVDDRPANLDFLSTLLAYRGHRVLQAADGAEALTLLATTAVDLVVSDILMPTMDGYELVRRMREAPQTADVPVIYFTAHYNQREARQLAEACGVARVLTKPTDPEVVLEAVDQVLSAARAPAAAQPPQQQFDRQHLQVVNAKLVAMTDELLTQAARMQALLEINVQLASERDPATLLAGFCRAARDLLAARHAVVAVGLAGSGTISYVTTSGMTEAVAAGVAAALKRDGAFADMIADPRTLRRAAGDGEEAMSGLPSEHPPVDSLTVAPIRSLQNVYGWIAVGGKLGLPAFTPEDEQILGIFAAQVGRIYENGSLAAELRRQADDLRREVAERRLAEHQTQRIFETSQDVILVTDGQGKFVRASPSVTKVLGYRPDEMIGQSGTLVVFPDDLDATREELRAARRGHAIRHFRCRYVHRQGHVVPLDWMAVWSEPDRLYYFMGRDMTEYERTEQQLRQAQKMEAVGQLTGGVAHDFNNILMVILANAENLEDDDRLAPELQAQVAAIGNATLRAAALTRQLLAFSRKQALVPQPTDINELAGAMARLLRRTLGEQIELELSLAGDIWEVEIDRAQLDSAIVNLGINARDAMPGGGRLTIQTRNATHDEDRAALGADGIVGDFVMLSLTDTGTGMSPAVLAHVFEPFFTTKPVGKGTGLGLSMVYGFIKQSRGHIRIDSEVGRGTCITLYLPRSVPRQKEVAPAQRPRVAQGNERILVVEDDTGVRRSIVAQLKRLGYATEEAPDGAAGLAALVAAPYDLLLTDLVMPGPMNGKLLGEEAKRRWPTMPVIVMSGYAEEAITPQGHVDPDVILLSKPFRMADLAATVRHALDGRQPSPAR
ncbi:MAG: response regulator [Reyranella sp.]|nr:response regulator [Reyranella sp.]